MEEGKKQTIRPDNQLFYDAFVASPIGIAVEDLEGRPLFVNPALCTMLGFSEEEMRKKHCVEFSPPEDAEKDDTGRPVTARWHCRVFPGRDHIEKLARCD